MRMIGKFTVAALAAAFALATTAFAAGEFEGTWKVKDTKGEAFEIVLAADGTASSTHQKDMTGTWKGTTVYEYGFATTPANVSQLSIIETFTGTINGCGTGSMSYRLFGTLSATGKIDLEWQTVEGFGSGALAGATGHGTAKGIYKADFSTTGDFTGELRCPRTTAPS